MSSIYSDNFFQANPKLATQKDEDDRLPIHWAVSYNHLPIVELLVSRKDFDPDVQVIFLLYRGLFRCTYVQVQDSSGWTPLMIASSLRDADDIIDLLLNKEADVNAKSKSRLTPNLFIFSLPPPPLFLAQTPILLSEKKNNLSTPPPQTTAAKQPSTSPPRKTTSKQPANSSLTKHPLALKISEDNFLFIGQLLLVPCLW